MADFMTRLDTVTAEGPAGDAAPIVKTACDSFAAAMLDDLNTSAALAAIFDLITGINKEIDSKSLTRDGAALVAQAMEEFDRVLGVLSLRQAEDARPPVPVDEIERLIAERKAARGRRDFAAADQIRVDLSDRGILLEDGPAGTRWKRK
jgi:cysteinyl-tRNA synthetase